MVKPVLDFEYKVQNTHNIKNSEPELSFISILKDTLQNNAETTNEACKQKEISTIEQDNNIAMMQKNAYKENTKEKNYEAVQEVSKHERIIADRRNTQNNDVYVEKLNVMQSLAGSSLHRNTVMAIVTDKNSHTVKQSVHKKDALHTLNLAYIDKDQKSIANSIIPKRSGTETINDTINQLQKVIDRQNNAKELVKSDIKQIAQLATLQHMGKKDLHSAVMVKPVIQYNELLDSKMKKVMRKTGNDDQPMNANEKTYKTVKLSEITILDAVKQKGIVEDAPKMDKKGGQATERNESYIPMPTKQNTVTNTTVAKPVVHDQLMHLLSKAKVMQEGEKITLSMKLYPESLGKLSVNLGLEQGILSGRFIVESQEAKELLLQQLESIRLELEHNGIEVGEFEVNVKEHRQREFTEIQKLSHKQNNDENAEYELLSNRYIYHDGLLDVII